MQRTCQCLLRHWTVRADMRCIRTMVIRPVYRRQMQPTERSWSTFQQTYMSACLFHPEGLSRAYREGSFTRRTMLLALPAVAQLYSASATVSTMTRYGDARSSTRSSSSTCMRKNGRHEHKTNGPRCRSKGWKRCSSSLQLCKFHFAIRHGHSTVCNHGEGARRAQWPWVPRTPRRLRLSRCSIRPNQGIPKGDPRVVCARRLTWLQL